ncbi:late competence development ComFB family protein [Ramlibacter sp. H39-3-26]|uniref:late competence development ComFB family protein n=1 Tax=Curvibacter soli TaxID=3031331 RepID=UPI0023DA7055|nr:late competence development ComFB family protein [Ramlibacter sp. H39-3-26]MDF1484297.1 late competence development ComFB family protein [Ramlibacter sp. H39-3-26]
MSSRDFEQIHNHYERLVLEEVARRAAQYPHFTDALLADVACMALNRLPARYVRHDADLMFYLTDEERRDTTAAVDEAVTAGFAQVNQRAPRLVPVS